MDPTNYWGTQSPVQPVTAGIDAYQQQQAASAQRALATQQVQAQQRQQALQQAALQDALQNPSPTTYRALALVDPSRTAAVKQAYDGLDEETQRQSLQDLTAFHNYHAAGRPDDANAIIQRHIEAAKKAGQPVDTWEALKSLDPKQAQVAAGLMLSTIGGADKMAAAYGAMGKEGREAAAEPGKEALTAAQAAEASASAASTAGLLPGKVANQKADTALKIAEAGKARADASIAMGAGDASLSPEAVAMVGQQYLSIGPAALANMGQGKVGVQNKSRIMDWVARTAREAGTSNPELVARFAQNKANSAALVKNTEALTAISASAHTLDANLDFALTLAKRGLGPTGVPLADLPINKLRSVLGSADAKTLDNVLTTSGDEYARILTTATGTGGSGTSDSARAEAHRLINNGMTLGQLTQAINAAKTEAANRKASYVNEGARLSGAISGIPQPPAPAASPAAAPGAGGWGKAVVVRR